MCGIVGYVGKKQNAIQVLTLGLKALEYRGYDSAGVAFKNEKKIKIIKSQGKISDLEPKVSKYSSILGIGHTRWATHGVPNEVNAHPHYSKGVTLVHNGIIENYVELKQILMKEGYKFKSETDSEVGAAYISYCYFKTKDKLLALKEASKEMKGSYALAIIFDDDLESIYAIRKESPLIVAIGEEENFVASDVPAILSFTNKFILLEKDEIARVREKKVSIFDKNLKEVRKPVLTYEGTKESVMKNGFEHFMLKEIYDESKVVENIIQSYFIDYKITTLNSNFGDFKKYKRIHIVACGSAAHAGYIGKYFLENISDLPVDIFYASEYRYNKIFTGRDVLTILISQSGETADTLAALRKAKKNGSYTLGIINVVGSSIARESDKVIYIKAGSEIAVATTKAYIAQVLILELFSILIAFQKKILSEVKANKILSAFKSLKNDIEKTTKCREEYLKIAETIYEKSNIFFIGRKIDYALCLEGSLKLKEISYIHSEAYASGELKHGTISLIEPGTPVIAVITDKTIEEKTVSNVKETKARGSFVILLTTKELFKKYEKEDFYDLKIIVDDTNDFKNPILAVVPLQLISYEVAKLRKESIDQPRNLAKSVTVE